MWWRPFGSLPCKSTSYAAAPTPTMKFRLMARIWRSWVVVKFERLVMAEFVMPGGVWSQSRRFNWLNPKQRRRIGHEENHVPSPHCPTTFGRRSTLAHAGSGSFSVDELQIAWG